MFGLVFDGNPKKTRAKTNVFLLCRYIRLSICKIFQVSTDTHWGYGVLDFLLRTKLYVESLIVC